MSRISSGTMIVGIFAVLFGLAGAYLVRQQMLPKPAPEQPAPPEERLVAVPLASADLEPGRPLKLGDVALVRMNAKQIQERQLPNEYMGNPQQIIGRILRSPVGKGQAFQTESFYPEGIYPSVADRLKPGYRAVTVSIKEVGAVSGLAAPGSTVDVLFRSEGSEDGSVPETTVTLLEGVEVLAVEQNAVMGARETKISKVTLAVTPSQANALKVVDDRGELSLSIRSSGDDTVAVSSEPLTLDGLLGLPKKQAPFKAEIYNGGSRQVITFDEDRIVDEKVSGLPVPPGLSSKSQDDPQLVGAAREVP